LNSRKENDYSSKINQLAIQDLSLWEKPELHPMLIEHCYQRKVPEINDFDTQADSDTDLTYEGYYPGCHLIVFVHGFQGS